MKDRPDFFKGSIYVTGFMASGKSTLGKALAEKLSMDFKDLDEMIISREGRSIHEIFEKDGEAYFRKMEKQYLLELTKQFKGVVALGGGALQNQQIVDRLKATGVLIYIETDIEMIVERVMSSTERPILYDTDGKIKSYDTLKTKLKTLYSNRLPFYEQAQLTIDPSQQTSVEEMVKAAIDKIKRYV